MAILERNFHSLKKGGIDEQRGESERPKETNSATLLHDCFYTFFWDFEALIRVLCSALLYVFYIYLR